MDDLIGAEQDHRWQDDTEGFRGLLVDDEADPGRLLNRQVINLRTAKALGLTIPPSLLLRADRVIE